MSSGRSQGPILSPSAVCTLCPPWLWVQYWLPKPELPSDLCADLSLPLRHAWQTPPYRSHAQFVHLLKDQPHIVHRSLASPHGRQTEPWSLSYHRLFLHFIYFACDSTKASSDFYTCTRHAELPTYIILTYKITRKRWDYEGDGQDLSASFLHWYFYCLIYNKLRGGHMRQGFSR